MYTTDSLPLSDLFHVFSSSLLALTWKLYHTAALFKRYLPSNVIRQPAQLFADALGLFFVTMHDGILEQGVKSLDRLNLLVSLRHRHSPVAMGSARLSLRFSVSWLSFLVSLRLAECNYILMVMIYLIGIWIPKRI